MMFWSKRLERGDLFIGDVVRLRCGGPKMVISARPANDPTVVCLYFDNAEEIKVMSFRPEILKRA